MDQRTFSFTVGAIFTAIAVVHLLRLLFGWEAMIAGWPVPRWISWVALVVAGYLAFEAIRLGRKPA
jgi:hypothetical protein